MSKRKYENQKIYHFFKKSIIVSVPTQLPSTSREVVIEVGNILESNQKNTSIQSIPNEPLIDKFDIGQYIKNNSVLKVDDYTKYNLIKNPWVPPKDYKFPFSEHNKKCKIEKRFLNHNHLTAFPWLVYSDIQKGLFCKYCPFFTESNLGGMHKTVALKKFVTEPLVLFAKLCGKNGSLNIHNENKYHSEAVQSGKLFLKCYETPTLDIRNQVDSHRNRQITENRKRLVPIIETIILLGRQNIAFRGHRDDGDLIKTQRCNEGNFREILKYRVHAGDKELEEHLKTCNSRATYISKTTQNELIDCCGAEILSVIKKRIDSSEFYSIIFDETTDISHISQMSIVIRYVYNCSIHEDFVTFLDCHGKNYDTGHLFSDEEPVLTGKIIGETVLNFLKENFFITSNCIGICTDGCSVMTSVQKGAVAVIQNELPHAVQCHCNNHALNISISKSSNVQSIRNSVGTMKEIINFFNASSKRNFVLKNILSKQLKSLCETRWVERHDSVILFKSSFSQIIKALMIISKWQESESSRKAKGFILCICNVEFIVALFCLAYSLAITLPFSKLLQKVNLDKLSAKNALSDCFATLKDQRKNSEAVFSTIFKEASDLMEELDVDVSLPRLAKRQKNRENPDVTEPIDYYRITTYIPMLESIIEDIKTRFGDDSLSILDLGIAIPSNIIKISPKTLQTSTEAVFTKFQFYLKKRDISIETLLGEVQIWQQKWQREKQNNGFVPADALASLANCDAETLPAIHNILVMLSTYPVSVAGAERSFSTLRRLKTWIRSTMTENRLIGLALLHIHSDIANEIKPSAIIDRYANKSNRRIEFLL